MSALDRTPTDLNLLQPSKYLFSFARIPTVQYFCQEIELPGITMGDAPFSTPFHDLQAPGGKISYDDLEITFLIDESLQGWQELHAWFRAMAAPTGFDERNRLSALQSPSVTNATKRGYTDATLIILNNLNNPTIRVQFYDCFPVSLGKIQFSTTAGATTVLTGSATFKFDYFDFVAA